MTDINKLVRKNVLNLTPYSSARDEFSGSQGVFMDANENPFGSLNRYPDPYQRELKKKISIIKNVAEEKIFLGNGSDEIIDLSLRIFCNPGRDKILTFTPTYGMYEVAASINDVEVIKVPLTSDFQIDIKNASEHFSDPELKIVFICTPNNPTSNAMSYNDVIKVLSGFEGIVLIDEAYIDFTKERSFTEQIDAHPNLIVMQTFSKAYGMAAARVGMAFSGKEIISLFNKMKPPYNISSINQKAILEKLDKIDEYNIEVAEIISERSRLAAELKYSELVEKVYPSDSNFLLAKVKNATQIYNLLVAKNIIVRNRTSVINNCLRITVGKKDENDLLIKALKDIKL
jgi:histidinol-phosphate aminotransferase